LDIRWFKVRTIRIGILFEPFLPFFVVAGQLSIVVYNDGTKVDSLDIYQREYIFLSEKMRQTLFKPVGDEGPLKISS